MKKINLIAAVIAVILSVAGCQKTAAETSSDAVRYYRLRAISVDMIESLLYKLPGDVEGVELTITDPNPDLSEIRQIMKSYQDILFKLDLSKCTAMTSIGKNAFDGCGRLSSVTIPDGVTSIGDRAFMGCNELRSVTIGKGVTSIGDEAFYDCYSVPIIKINAVTPPSVGRDPFIGFIIVPAESVAKYKAADGWTEYVRIYGSDKVKGDFIMDGTTLIGLYNRTKTEIVIPDGVTSIGDYAFAGCIGLTSVTIGKGVTSIGDYAFAGCIGLTTLSVKAIDPPTCGSYMLSPCSNLTAIYVPAGSVSAYKWAGIWSEYFYQIQGKNF